MLEQYISEQKKSIETGKRRLELSEKIQRNLSFLKSMSDTELRIYNINSLNKSDDSHLRLFEDAEKVVIYSGPGDYHFYETALVRLRDLRKRWINRTVTEEEFKMVDSVFCCTDIIYHLEPSTDPRNPRIILDATLANVDWGTYK